jgi:hypothetical protein
MTPLAVLGVASLFKGGAKLVTQPLASTAKVAKAKYFIQRISFPCLKSELLNACWNKPSSSYLKMYASVSA